MKKLIIVAVAAMSMAVMAEPAATQQSEWDWSWWTTSPDNTQRDFRGCLLGFASDVKTVTGAQISAFVSKAGAFKSGCQFAIGYSRATTLRNGCQLAFFNRSDCAALQFGLHSASREAGFRGFSGEKTQMRPVTLAFESEINPAAVKSAATVRVLDRKTVKIYVPAQSTIEVRLGVGACQTPASYR